MIINFLKIHYTCTQRAANLKFVVQQCNYLLEGLSSVCLKFSHATIGNPASDSLNNTCLEICKVKFKRNIHNMLLQKLSEANEYIDLLDLNMS